MIDLTLQETLLGHQNPIYTIESDTENNLLYSAGVDKGVVEWDLDTLTFKRILCAVPTSVYILHIIPNSGLLAIGMRSGEIFIVETARQKLKAKLKVDNGAVFSIKSLPGKQELIAIGEEGKAYVWSLLNFDLLYSFQISNSTVRIIAFDPSRMYLAFGDKDGAVHLYTAEDYHHIASTTVHEKSVTSLSFFHGSLWSGGRDAKMHKLSSSNLDVEQTITPHMFTVYGILPLHNSRYFSTVSRDKTIKIWDETLKLQRNISQDRGVDSHYLSINCQAYDTGLRLLATAGDDKVIKIWKVDF